MLEYRLTADQLPRFTFEWMREHESQFEPRSVRWVRKAPAARASGVKRSRDAAGAS